MNRLYFTDTATATLEYAGEGSIGADDFEDDFDPSDAETVTIDTKWTDFFDTEEYVQFDATVAQPIVQPYIYDGQLRKFRKDEDELKRAQAQLDNLPWTMGHPPHDRVTNANQIRGFWDSPRWDDGQRATLNIPANDPEAVRFAVTNDEVSVGFGGTLDWDDATDDYDAVQRNMAYDHVASVENGRCPPDEGCGLHATESTDPATSVTSTDEDTDTDPPHKNIAHGHVFADAVQTQSVKDPLDEQWSDGDWVAFTDEGTRVHGQIMSIDDGEATVRVYDSQSDDLSEETTTVTTDDLMEWVGPHADSCPGDDCHCGCHEGESFADQPSGIYTEDGDWYGIAPSETAEDEPKYDLNNCNDVKDAYNLRNNGDYDVEVSTLVGRIKRAADAHDCPDENRPWTDSAQPSNEQTTSDESMSNIETLLDENDIDEQDLLDHFDIEVKKTPHDFYDGEPSVEDLADDFDAVDLLIDEKESIEEQVDSLEDEVRDAQRPLFEDKAERLAELVDKWGDKDDIMEHFDADDEDERWSVDDIEDKIELVEDVRSSETTSVTDESDDGGSDPDIETTDQGRFDLRDRTKVAERP